MVKQRCSALPRIPRISNCDAAIMLHHLEVTNQLWRNAMALIICPDCDQGISDTAPQCVHCGYRHSTSPTVTIEVTSKMWKAAQAVGAFGAILSLMLRLGGHMNWEGNQLFETFIFLFTLLYISSRVMAWWENG
jgi:hypothetical protein